MTVTLIPLKKLTALGKVELFSKRPSQLVRSIKSSISRDGLLNPLVVVEQGKCFHVIDGKKRLLAIRQLAKEHKQSRALNKIPCIVQNSSENIDFDPRRPLLMTAPDIAHAIITQMDLGHSSVSVAQRYECDYQVVDDALSLKQLHPTILSHFNNEVITLEQASAFATIPNPEAQLNLLLQLGPFVQHEDIIKAIKTGETVIETPDGNVVILPSRRTPRLTYKHQSALEASNVYPFMTPARHFFPDGYAAAS